MICCLCGKSEENSFLNGSNWRLVRCSCGMIWTGDFATQALSYNDDDYFVSRNRYVQQWDLFSRIFDALMDKISKFKSGGRLLDVGAGVGTLVDAANRKGFCACGVEVSSWASRFAREEKNLEVITGYLEVACFSDECFDVVTLNHVLEHVENPLALLSEIRRILRPDGLLVIGVPNIGSIMASLKGVRWASLRPNEHIWHFTTATLRMLSRQSGFTDVMFESRDNYAVSGWSPKELATRLINLVAVATGRSEAMLLFCIKTEPWP